MSAARVVDFSRSMQRIVQLDAFADGRKIVTVTERLYIVLGERPTPAVVLPLETVCPFCEEPLKSWALPKSWLDGVAVACRCATAVAKPNWTAEGLALHWRGIVAITRQAERADAPPRNN